MSPLRRSDGSRARTFGNLETAALSFWHPVLRADALEEDHPTGVQVAGNRYVVFRIGSELVGYEDSCPHRSFPLSEGCVVNGELQCSYHGYRFSSSGNCTHIPAISDGTPISPRANLRPVAGIAEHLGLIWIAPLPPRLPLPEVPQLHDPSFGHVLIGPTLWRAGAAQMTDNFLDVSHFPFVHAGTFGLEDEAVVPPFTVERDGLRFTYTYRHQFRNNEQVARTQGTTQPRQARTFRGALEGPFCSRYEVDYEHTGVRTVVLAACTPVDADSTLHFVLMLGTDFESGDATIAAEFEKAILFEDQLALERYPQREMVLDLDAEYHTGADKMTVEYRRVMRQVLDG